MGVEIGRRGELVISPDEQQSRAAVLALSRREERIAELETALRAVIEATLDHFPQELPPRIGETLKRGQKLIKTFES